MISLDVILEVRVKTGGVSAAGGQGLSGWRVTATKLRNLSLRGGRPVKMTSGASELAVGKAVGGGSGRGSVIRVGGVREGGDRGVGG